MTDIHCDLVVELSVPDADGRQVAHVQGVLRFTDPQRPSPISERRLRHPNSHRLWSAADDARLVERLTEGATVAELMSEFGPQPQRHRGPRGPTGSGPRHLIAGWRGWRGERPGRA